MFHVAVFGEIGYIALLLAGFLSFLLAIIPAVAVFTHHQPWQQTAPFIALAATMSVCISFVCLLISFYHNDFSLSYVANHSNTLMPWYYKLSATWGGHEGSLLLWAMLLSIWTLLVAYFGRVLPLYMHVTVLSVLGVIQCFILWLTTFSSSPFERISSSLPVDGASLNPLLQDPGLIFHPPILYMGYVGMAVPFSFAVAALLVGRLDSSWTRWTRPWVLAAWSFLTIGIAMGSWWAYLELGWGGWWFWDPVENASLLPWLASTALIHSLIVTEKRGVFKAWTVMLAILAFALSLLGTFLVRSGVLSSVHSFASDPERGLHILITLGVLVGSACVIYALRAWKLTAESTYSLRSRESLLAINNMLLMTATLVVLLGTLYPIIAEAFGLGQVSIGAPYYNAMFVPLTWILLLFFAYAPIVRWKKDTKPLLGVSITIAITALSSSLLLLFFLTKRLTHDLNNFITLALVAWVIILSLYDIKQKIQLSRNVLHGLRRLPMSYWSMQIAHGGVLVFCIGITFTTTMSIQKDVFLQPNQSIIVTHQNALFSEKKYEFTLHNVQKKQQDNYYSTYASVSVHQIIDYHNKQKIVELTPEKRQYSIQRQGLENMSMPMTEPAVHATLWQDIYVALGDSLEEKNQPSQWAIRIYIKPFVRWIWLGAIIMAFAGFLAMFDKKLRK